MKAKAIIVSSAAAAVISVSSIAVPATTSALSMGLGSGSTKKSSTKISVGPNGMTFESNKCETKGFGAGVSLFGSSKQQTTVNGCDTATQVVNNPPANSVVTINGLCDDDAAKAKTNVTGNNVTVIVNSTGACEEEGTPVPTKPVEVIVTPKAPQPTATTASVTTTSTPAATTDPKGSGVASESPVTGTNEVIVSVVATILAASTYGGTMVIRVLRARA